MQLTHIKGLLSVSLVFEDDGRDTLALTLGVVGKRALPDWTDGGDKEFLKRRRGTRIGVVFRALKRFLFPCKLTRIEASVTSIGRLLMMALKASAAAAFAAG